MASTTLAHPVRWRSVWSLASVQGAISLCWIAYAIYLPQFFEQVFGYSTSQAEQLTALLLVLESAIAVVIEPLFGGLSDVWQRWFGSRMPLIVVGAIASTVLFLAIPSVVIFGNPSGVMRLLLAGLTALWAIVMSTFRSPVLSLLGNCAGASQLPLAGSVLTLVGGLIGATKPLAKGFILGLGAPMAFTIASVTLLAGVAILRTTIRSMPPKATPVVVEAEPLPLKAFLKHFVVVMLVGAAIGLGMRVLMGEVVPRTLRAEMIGFTGLPFDVLMGAVLIIQALFALATGAISKWIDNKRLMIISFGGIGVGLGLLSLGGGAIAAMLIILFMLFGVSAINNGMVAFALTMVPQTLSGLIVGIFFSGLSWATALFGYWMPQSAQMLSLSQALVLTAIAFLSAGVGVAFGERLTRQSTVE